MTNNLPSLAPRTLEEARAFAQIFAKSNFCPKDYKDKPDEILIAAQMGAEIGLGFIESTHNIAVINGRPSIWGDAMLALVQASGLLKFHKEYFDEKETAVCEVARKGDIDEHGKQVVHVVKFSDADRDKAGLTNKGTHASYPKRMKQMRARGFALRDKFADVLKGLIAREEAIDITPMVEDVQQLDMGTLSEEEIPRAVEMVMDSQPELAENPGSGVEWYGGDAPVELPNEPAMPASTTVAGLVLDQPATSAEQKAFMDFVKGRNRPQDIALIKAVPKWTDVRHATKRQIAAAREKLENATRQETENVK